MKTTITIATLLLIYSGCVSIGHSENSLEVLSALCLHDAPASHPSASVTAKLKHSDDKYLLAFKLTNISTKPLMIYPHKLPWGNPHSITLAAVATDGRRIPNWHPIADPSTEEEISIAPGTSLEGDYDISRIVQLSLAPKDKDLVVIWAYEVPGDLKSPLPICTGIVVIGKKINE
jgi:hypothetical protein